MARGWHRDAVGMAPGYINLSGGDRRRPEHQREAPGLLIGTRSAMMRRDYYEILGVSKSCTDAEMKAAFRKAAMQCHPDRNPGNTEAEIQFKALKEANKAC